MNHSKKILRLLLLLSLLAVLLVYLGFAVYYRTHFFSGSFINHINYSGKTVSEVESDIAHEISKYQITIEGRNGIQGTITAADIDYHYVSDGQVAALKYSQNPLLWPFSVFTRQDLDMQIVCQYDKKLLFKSLKMLPFFLEEVIQEPVSASIAYNEGTGYSIRKEELGTTLDFEKLEAATQSAIEESAFILSLEDTDCYIHPAVYADDEVIQAALETLNKYTGVTIIYDFSDRTEILNCTLLHEWVSVDENFQVTLNKQKVVDYVNYLGYYYTTFSSTRDFIRHDGKTIQVKGGDYGWIINRPKEVEELYALILNGQSVTREPVYSQTAVSRNKNDIGNTYVEVSIQKQHLWLFVDGQQVIDSAIVTGNVSRNYGTPTGIYAITYKERNATLVGQDYSSPVNYWMPFNHNIGFHDAPWRKEFGKDIYEKNGSHGCVNMPPKKAEILYSSIQKGTPVVVY